jgi:hypothetical protein
VKLNDKEGEECVCVAAAHMRAKVAELLVQRGGEAVRDALKAVMGLPPAA